MLCCCCAVILLFVAVVLIWGTTPSTKPSNLQPCGKFYTDDGFCGVGNYTPGLADAAAHTTANHNDPVCPSNNNNNADAAGLDYQVYANSNPLFHARCDNWQNNYCYECSNTMISDWYAHPWSVVQCSCALIGVHPCAGTKHISSTENVRMCRLPRYAWACLPG